MKDYGTTAEQFAKVAVIQRESTPPHAWRADDGADHRRRRVELGLGQHAVPQAGLLADQRRRRRLHRDAQPNVRRRWATNDRSPSWVWRVLHA
jgi:hypothetical protein